MYNSGIAVAAQQQLVARLQGDALFDGTISNNGQSIDIIQEIRGDIENMISVNLGKIGVSVVVLTPTFQLFDYWLPSLAGWLMQQINVFEDPIFNATPSGTGTRAIDICERITALMHMWPAPTSFPVSAGIPSRWQCLAKPWEFVRNTSNPVQYIVSLQLNVQLPQPTP
jgi:hypothetical protein